MRAIAVYGASDQVRCTVDLIERAGTDRVVGYLDDRAAPGAAIEGYPVLGPGAEILALRDPAVHDGEV
ncbi:hypothetical protein BH23ACT2_BH23ACT2_24640 [soil metagenome]